MAAPVPFSPSLCRLVRHLLLDLIVSGQSRKSEDVIPDLHHWFNRQSKHPRPSTSTF